MSSKYLKICLVLVVGLSLLVPQAENLAQENLERACDWNRLQEKPDDLSRVEYKSLLKRCQNYYQERSQEIQGEIQQTQQRKQTLQDKIYSLNREIQSLNYQINQSNLMVKDLKYQINDTKKSIQETSIKIQNSTRKLSKILQTVYEQEKKSTAEILLSEDKLSGFIDNLMALEVLNTKNRELLNDIKDLKSYLQQQKGELNQEKAQLEEAVKMKRIQKKESAEVKQDKQYYLGLTEQKYQQQKEKKEQIEQKADKIRKRLFAVVGIPEAPTFGEALNMARSIEDMTGVRPAFLLAVLNQESNIFREMNVGQCYLKDPDTGDGIVANSGRKVEAVMKPTRDVQPFLEITKDLGRDPYSTPVSCPIPSVGGYGGAMGPAQFIPSTWDMYDEKVEQITGQPANPWSIKHAFLAAGLLLKDNGAATQTYSAEWKAAMRYFSGGTNPAYSFYGNSVMSKAKKYAQDIKTLDRAQ